MWFGCLGSRSALLHRNVTELRDGFVAGEDIQSMEGSGFAGVIHEHIASLHLNARKHGALPQLTIRNSGRFEVAGISRLVHETRAPGAEQQGVNRALVGDLQLTHYVRSFTMAAQSFLE